MTYLEMVNKVLRRMREKEVSSVSATPYSKLVGDLLNDVKDEVEHSWNWNALRYTYKIDTSASFFNYVLTDATSGVRFVNAWNDTEKIQLEQLTTEAAERRFLVNRDPGAPSAFNINGADINGNVQVDVWPIPDGIYRLTFNVFMPQPLMVQDGTTIKVPWKPVVEGTVARAIQERGDDGALGADIQNVRYNRALADAIANDANMHEDEITWVAV